MIFRLSGLNSWHDCQRRVAAKCYRDQIPGLDAVLRPESNHIGSSVGTACHAGVESLLRAKMQGLSKPASLAIDGAVAELEKLLNESPAEMDDATGNRNDAIRQVASIVDIFAENVLPKFSPVRIEERFEFSRGDLTFSGQIDWQDNKFNICDLKTSKHLGVYFPQIGGYNINLGENKIPTGEYSFVVHIPRLKVKHDPYSKILRYNTVDCEKVARKYMNQIEQKFAAFDDSQNPEIFSANPASTLCNEKYCPAFGTEFCNISRIKPEEIKE